MESKKKENETSKMHPIKKPPQVRQTLASKYRMLKANPLLVMEMTKKLNATLDNKDEVVVAPLKTLVAVLNSEPEGSISNNFITKTTNKNSRITTGLKRTITEAKVEKKPLKRESLHPNFHRQQYNLNRNLKIGQQKLSLQPQKVSTKTVNNATKSVNKSSFLTKNSVTKDCKPKESTVSTVQKKNNLTNSHSVPVWKNNLKKTTNKEFQSVNKITNLITTKTADFNATGVMQNGKENLVEHSKTFLETLGEKLDENSSIFQAEVQHNKLNGQNLNILKNTLDTSRNNAKSAHIFTPSNRRNTLCGTPRDRRQSVLMKSQSAEIATQLNDWLKKKGKSVGSFHHLKCFGLHANDLLKIESEQNERKENIELNGVEKNKETEIPKEDLNLEAIAQNALYDLHKLILEGYTLEQCALWLKLIKEKCRKVEEGPQYWECRAALEQTRGNIRLAVECYQNAIIQGAEVQEVDSCLDQLYQKFNLLSIDEPTSLNTEKIKIQEDMKNIFKSNIIQFAVQEKVCKKKSKDGFTSEKKYVATPVRRSTRLSRSAFTSTPGVKIYSSLKDVDNSIKHLLDFQCNNALKD